MASFTSHAASSSPTIARNQQDAATSYLQSLEAVPSLPPLSHLLTTEQHDLAAAAAAAAAVAADHQSPVTSSVNTTPHPSSMGFSTPTTSAAAVSSSDGLYYTQTPVIPPTVPSAMMMGPAGSHPADMFPLDSQFLPLDATTTSMANINPYPSIAPRRERNSSVSSSASSDTNKVYSFVAIPGTNQKKRPRRRYDEIERLYHCNWQGCTKAYGTLNHLNAHVSMQKHGPKRSPAEFKEMRKEWRRQKKEREAARKAADEHMKKEIINHQQHQQQQFAAAAAAAAMPLHSMPPQLGSYAMTHQMPTHASQYQPIGITPNYAMSSGLPGFY
ncbi:hypothetical protein NQZ79_g237 [Umbelopsis isabellina]|nr:hypothetical protein NQZ79_g237 [Umbelopsis isabellina]